MKSDCCLFFRFHCVYLCARKSLMILSQVVVVIVVVVVHPINRIYIYSEIH